jgi:hypothetical protein
MSHFAKVEDGIVTNVQVGEQEHFDTLDGTWIQTSYNTRGGKHYAPNSIEEDSGTPLRKNYASIGNIYDSVRDAFYIQQPFPSWILNEDTCYWEAPVTEPEPEIDENNLRVLYNWDEDTTSWVLPE